MCDRCLSTGRVCDGYGIWGGGGNNYGSRQRLLASADRRITHSGPSTQFAFIPGTKEERAHIEWFELRTVKKIPGPFPLGFWQTDNILQICVAEPAVFHALLTLTSVHQKTCRE